MDKNKIEYDKKRRHVTYRCDVRGKTLLDKSIGLAFSRLVRSGRFDDQPVETGSVHFADEAAAQHNAGPLKFLGLVAEHRGGTAESSDRFVVRRDFGLE